MRRCQTLIVPAATSHKAPITQAFAGIIGVVQVRETEKQMTQFVCTYSQLTIFRNGQVGKYLCAVCIEFVWQYPFMTPDIVFCSCLFCTTARMDQYESIHIPVFIII